MQVSIDRIESGIAVLIGRDDETVRVTLPAASLPDGCAEGDILTLTMERDPGATADARARVAGRIGKLRTGGHPPGS
jgi:hypothetical protein